MATLGGVFFVELRICSQTGNCTMGSLGKLSPNVYIGPRGPFAGAAKCEICWTKIAKPINYLIGHLYKCLPLDELGASRWLIGHTKLFLWRVVLLTSWFCFNYRIDCLKYYKISWCSEIKTVLTCTNTSQALIVLLNYSTNTFAIPKAEKYHTVFKNFQ